MRCVVCVAEFAGNRLPSKTKLERLTVLIGATQAESAELEAVRERLAWDARADDSERHMLSVFDALDPDEDEHVVQQLAAVLLQSAAQRQSARSAPRRPCRQALLQFA
ncbi:hypothetical protein EV644_12464 [Kribbella orskensis]|uniref:Uncharacterized protein n=1 Tax=Kribbella orskensis TaxID=2512216 RepID=A0ABY2BBX7_9ACTN|nr:MULTISPECIES: hypothetical protein [Kribbella]TCN32742.1 hypothetical protein EV642_12634 [Kribbella sp. VKM Ac-2500]TCO12940.1 hypothetical protein EV644_12464 [Kribbella orskensis]